MPVDALPEPRRHAPLEGAVPFARRYADALGRPLSGTVTLTPLAAATVGGVVVPAAPVPVDLAGGWLRADLPPGDYRLAAALRTVEGHEAPVNGTVTITPPEDSP